MSNFTATGMFVPIAFALSATNAPITLIERERREVGAWSYAVTYRPPERPVQCSEYTVAAAQLEVACDPGALVSDLIVALLHEVHFPDQALIEAQELADYVVDGGLLEAELVGGFHDGRILPDLPLDREHFPPLDLKVPLPRPWAPDDGAYPTTSLSSVTYRRDRLDPARRVWLYRFGK